MGDLDIYYQSGGMVNPTLPREYATADLKKKFEELMAIIQSKLGNKDTKYTQEDANIIALALNELYMLQRKGGFEYSMNDAANLLFSIFKTTGYDPTGSKPNLKIDLKSLQSINDRGIIYQDINVKMEKILEIIDVKNFAQAGNTLGDATLDFARWAYNNYAKEVEDLAKSVEAARRVIDNLSALQGILNHVEKPKHEDYKFPPDKLSDIPLVIQDKLMKEPAIVKALMKPGQRVYDWQDLNKPEEFAKLKAYLVVPPLSGKMADWSDEYFKKQLESMPVPQAADIPAVLNLRDNLIRQMVVLKEGNAPTGEGTPYDTISKLLDTIHAQFPEKTYPVPVPNPKSPTDSKTDLTPGKDWNVEFGGPPFTFDKINMQRKYPSAQDQITNWIKSGQGSGKTNDLLDQALNANQRLSDDMSKKLQAKNQQLTQIMDMLTQLIDMLNKILSGTAQKIARG